MSADEHVQPLTHPQYIDGTLYLTETQIDALRERFTQESEPGDKMWYHQGSGAVWGIPIITLQPNVPVTVGDIMILWDQKYSGNIIRVDTSVFNGDAIYPHYTIKLENDQP